MYQSGTVSGLLNINKPKGLTSHDVVVRVRKLSKQRKVGHTGTLDPMATGVLLVCLGQATRLIEYIMLARKHYRAVIRFGAETDSLDADGQIVRRGDTSLLTEHQLKEISLNFLGEIEQVPPMFSALKRGGQPLYKRARAGEIVELDSRPVTIYHLDWVAWNPPDLSLDIVCSPGTYIRALARDLGKATGTGAYLAELTRTANGDWSLDQAVTLDTLEREAELAEMGWQKYLYPPDQAIKDLPKVVLDEAAVAHVKHGRQVELSPSIAETNLMRAYTPAGEFLAILQSTQPDKNIWQPKKVFN